MGIDGHGRNGCAANDMAQQAYDDPVRVEARVLAPPELAFVSFAGRMATWWPAENTWARDALDTIVVEPHGNGRWFERRTDGGEQDWGRVLVWEPPHRLGLTWQLTPQWQPEPDPDKASEITVEFTADGPGATRVVLEHRHFARHGEGWEGMRTGMASPEGWTLLIGRYAASLA